MTLDKKVRLFFLTIILLVIASYYAPYVFAQGDHKCQGGHNCNEAESIVGAANGDEFRALSLSQSLGDVAVSGCIVTTQWGIIIYQRQGYRYDVFCLARELDAVGKYADAAAMRCLHKIPTKLYGGRCLSVMNFEPPEPNPTKTLVGAVLDTDDRYVQQQEEIEYLREETASLVGQLEKITQQIEQAPASQQQAQQQIDSAAERRAKSRKAYEEALSKGSEQ